MVSATASSRPCATCSPSGGCSTGASSIATGAPHSTLNVNREHHRDHLDRHRLRRAGVVLRPVDRPVVPIRAGTGEHDPPVVLVSQSDRRSDHPGLCHLPQGSGVPHGAGGGNPRLPAEPHAHLSQSENRKSGQSRFIKVLSKKVGPLLTDKSTLTPLSPRLALLLALCALLFFLGLGTLGLTDRDEGSNAEAAREMVASGDWITPTLNGAPRFAKPILIYWLISGSYLAFGVSEFTARLPSALFGTLLVLMQYAFATRMFGPTVGLRAALMLLLNFEVLALGRMVLTDMVLVFFATLSIFCFFLAASPPDGRGRAKRWYWGFYIGMALATLTKGPVGVLVPLLAVIPYLLLTGRWREVARECRLLPGTAVFLLIPPPWYAPIVLLHGAGYAESARGDTLTRFFSVIGGHGGTILFYIPLLLLRFFPWSGVFPSALVEALRERQGPPRGVGNPVAGWVLGVVIFFSPFPPPLSPHIPA